MLLIQMPGEKVWNTVPACIFLKNLQNSVPERSITKIPLATHIPEGDQVF
jgi:hypothetical protein